MKRPSKLLYAPVTSLVVAMAALKGQKVERRSKIQGPAIILSNHTSFYDFIFTVRAAYPHRINFMVAAKYFNDSLLGPILRAAHAIPKHLFQPDLAAVKSTFGVLKNNGIVGIFPEGQISPIGKTYQIDDNIAKLVKKSKVPVYVIKHHHAYFVNPPWSKKTFKGRIHTTVDQIITKEDCLNNTVAELQQKIQVALDYNASQYVKIDPIKVKVQPIEGLQYVLYRCPHCEKDSLQAKGKALHCIDCGLELSFNEDTTIGSYRIDELYQQQIDDMRRRITSTVHYTLTGSVTLEMFVGKKVMTVGKGILTMNGTTYEYRGTQHGKPVVLNFPTKAIPTLPADLGQNVQIYSDDELYQFHLDDGRLSVPMVIAGELFYQLANS